MRTGRRPRRCGFEKRKIEERFCLIIPKWHIETWLMSLSGFEVDEIGELQETTENQGCRLRDDRGRVCGTVSELEAGKPCRVDASVDDQCLRRDEANRFVTAGHKLRSTTLIPRSSLILVLPRNSAEWIETSEECMISSRRAYWAPLPGMRETRNTAKISVRLPRPQQFNVEQLPRFMQRACTQERL